MGQCKLCNKKGLFLKLNKGYCNECFNKIVFYQKKSEGMLIQFSETNNIDTYFSRYDFLINLIYEFVEVSKYIPLSQPPHELMRKLNEQYENSINELIERSSNKVRTKILELKTNASKTKHFTAYVDSLKNESDRFSSNNKETALKACKELQKLTTKTDELSLSIFDVNSKRLNIINTQQKINKILNSKEWFYEFAF